MLQQNAAPDQTPPKKEASNQWHHVFATICIPYISVLEQSKFILLIMLYISIKYFLQTVVITEKIKFGAERYYQEEISI